MRNDVPAKGKGRRKSAFAEEEEGYMFVEEGFRIRFANGETIDFYADSAAEKDGWMKVLSEVVGKDATKPKSWTDLVLAKQRAAASRADQAKQVQVKTSTAASAAKQAPPLRSAPPTPAKHFSHPNIAPPTPEKSPRRSDIGSRTAERAKARSMMF